MVHRLYRIVVILFYLELGLFLVILPWSSFWERNYFLYRFPVLTPWLLNHYLRGAITGVGLADIVLGIWQALHFRRLVAARVASLAPEVTESVARGQTA